jgi:hypothetical protein
MSSLSPQVHDIVFAKTAKGRAEVVRRSAGLSGRHRSILIMLDGEKTLRNIGTLLPEGEMARIVEILLELELIAPWAEVVVSADVHVEAAELSRIKTMMTDSAETCLGLMASEVVRRVQQARDETELLSVVGHWHMAMRESKYGRDVAAGLLEQITMSLRGRTVR